jgi:hypothetical protein
MVEDLRIMVSNGQYGIDVREKGIFKLSLGKIKCAVCPECGYTETYIDNPESIKKPIVKVGPKSGTYKSKRDDPSKWVEIFSPECDIEVKNFSLRDIKYIASNGKTVNVAPEKIFRCEDGKLNPDYPKTTPRGGTGKVRIFQGRFE